MASIAESVARRHGTSIEEVKQAARKFSATGDCPPGYSAVELMNVIGFDDDESLRETIPKGTPVSLPGKMDAITGSIPIIGGQFDTKATEHKAALASKSESPAPAPAASYVKPTPEGEQPIGIDDDESFTFDLDSPNDDGDALAEAAAFIADEESDGWPSTPGASNEPEGDDHNWTAGFGIPVEDEKPEMKVVRRKIVGSIDPNHSEDTGFAPSWRNLKNKKNEDEPPAFVLSDEGHEKAQDESESGPLAESEPEDEEKAPKRPMSRLERRAKEAEDRRRKSEDRKAKRSGVFNTLFWVFVAVAVVIIAVIGIMVLKDWSFSDLINHIASLLPGGGDSTSGQTSTGVIKPS